MNEIKLNRVYRHFKGNYYYVLEIVLSSETLEEMVIYQGLYEESKKYVRPLKMFLDEIDQSREDNITKQKYRFELIELDKENKE